MKKKYEPISRRIDEPDGGKHVNDVVKIMTGVAKKLGWGMALVFNRKVVIVNPGDKPDTIVDSYHKTRSPNCAKPQARKYRRQRSRRQKRKDRR